MYCANCGKHLAYCDCPDIEERLEALANNPIVGNAIKQNILARRMVKKKEKPERRETMAKLECCGSPMIRTVNKKTQVTTWYCSTCQKQVRKE